MSKRIISILRRNLVAYLALFVALGGTSYAAVRLTPGSVHTRALANRAVTHKKLAGNSVTSSNVANRSLTAADFKLGTIRAGGVVAGAPGAKGDKGEPGPTGPRGAAGGAYIGAQARSTGSVSAPHGASTNIPFSSNTWTQDAGELDLITGSATLHIPSSCTGSFGNSLVVSVDGTASTFAVAPAAPASTTVTVPLVVGTLSEPAAATQHTVTAALGNSCTKAGEDYTVSNVKLDVLKFNTN